MRRSLFLLVVPLLAVGLAACGSTVSTAAFKGEEQKVAQAIANLQADTTAAEYGKLCSDDLSAETVARLGGKSGCEQAMKDQVTEIDNLELSVQSIHIDSSGKTATAHVKSTYAGKTRPGMLSLVNQGGSWKISGVQ